MPAVGSFNQSAPLPLAKMNDPRSHPKPHEEGSCFVTLRVGSWIVRCHRNKRTSKSPLSSRFRHLLISTHDLRFPEKMDNEEIARRFNRMASLMEVRGE